MSNRWHINMLIYKIVNLVKDKTIDSLGEMLSVDKKNSYITWRNCVSLKMSGFGISSLL